MAERILLVEDDQAISQLTARALESLGYEFAGTVMSGEEAIEAVRSDQPALVLMDIGLAGPMDGVEAARQIRLQLDVPVVFLTAADDDETLGRAKATEPMGYIVKPFEPRNLHTTIEIALSRHAMEKRRAEDALRQAERSVRARFENAVAGMLHAASDGEFLRANQALADLLGYSSPEELAKAAHNVRQVLTADLDPVLGQSRLLQNPGATKQFELQAYRKDGTTVWVSGNARAVRNAGGEILYYEGSVTDVGTRQRIGISSG